ELPHVLVNQRVHRDLVRPLVQLLLAGEVAEEDQERRLEIRALLCELLDGDAAVAEDALVAVDEGDRAPRRRRVHVRGVVAEQPEIVIGRLDLAQLRPVDVGTVVRVRPIPDRHLVRLAGTVVGDGQRIRHGSSRLLFQSAQHSRRRASARPGTPGRATGGAAAIAAPPVSAPADRSDVRAIPAGLDLWQELEALTGDLTAAPDADAVGPLLEADECECQGAGPAGAEVAQGPGQLEVVDGLPGAAHAVGCAASHPPCHGCVATLDGAELAPQLLLESFTCFCRCQHGLHVWYRSILCRATR